jgi:cytochrome c biogenesis protein CcmG/thiol:disulfide interchange protein DsbE
MSEEELAQRDAPTNEGQTTLSSTPQARRWSVQPLVLLGALAVLGVLTYGVIAKSEQPLSQGPAPDFTLTLFDGGELSLSELRGQVVVINVWASWCPPCRDEAPVLEATWRRYRERGVTFVGVDYMDTEPAALSYLQEYGITYPNGPDLGSRIGRAYNVQGVPETFFVTPEGEIAELFVGPLSGARLTAILERLLAEKGGG